MRCCSSVRSAPTRQTGAQLQDGRPHVHPIDGIMAGGGRVVAGERVSSSSPHFCVSSRTHHALPCACRLPQLSSQLSLPDPHHGPRSSCAPLTVQVLGRRGQALAAGRGERGRAPAMTSSSRGLRRCRVATWRGAARFFAHSVAHARRAGPCGRSADRLRSVGCPTHASSVGASAMSVLCSSGDARVGPLRSHEHAMSTLHTLVPAV